MQARVNIILLIFGGLVLALAGCKSQVSSCELSVGEHKTLAEKPALISSAFTVDLVCKDRSGKVLLNEPALDLHETDFKLFENGAPVSPYESRHSFFNSPQRFRYNTLLLLDLSGSVHASDLGVLKAAADSFIRTLIASDPAHHHVALYAFDGRPQIHQIADFSNQPDSLTELLNAIQCPGPYCRDESTNLNGAIINGLGILEMTADQHLIPIQVEHLVVFTDGTDRSGFFSDQDVRTMLRQVPDHTYLYTVGLGAEIDQAALRAIGRDGAEMAYETSQLMDGFTKIAKRIERQSKRYYRLNYCSPRRSGQHRLRIDVSRQIEFGGKKLQASGSFETGFDASGFQSGCALESAERRGEL
ncbi:MAG: hypothetical protein A2X94_16470 [Bdellovibrionales bacterium GWB1_55_8]|nr:MAG: hypothetical protein A2X94_16470 [Bdellovibrionales bacterium GWB1_55_8]